MFEVTLSCVKDLMFQEVHAFPSVLKNDHKKKKKKKNDHDHRDNNPSGYLMCYEGITEVL